MKTTIRLLIFISILLSALTPFTPARAATLTVTSTSDSGAGSLRAVLASAAAGDTITFDPTLSGGTIALLSTLTLSQNVNIDGAGPTLPITISGDSDNNGSGDVQIFVINTGVTVTLNRLKIRKGSAVDGGGINNSGILTITNSLFLDNVVTGFGGAIDNNGSLSVTNTDFNGNQADSGGAIDNYSGGSATISNSSFSGNSVTYYGGAINNESTMTIKNSTINTNTAKNGGAIENYYATLTISNSTLYGNIATGWGGGIENSNSQLNVTNSTFSNNSSVKGGGGIDNFNSSTLNLINTILANSPSGGDCLNTATLGTNINNLVQDGGCSAGLTGDPLLGTLSSNGGPTQTMSLLLGSPAINAGSNTDCAADPINNLDQRGTTRPQGAQCDIGAFERVPDTVPPTVYSIITASANPTSAVSVDFTVTFSEAVTGVNTGDFNLIKNGVSGAAVTGVSGSGSIYTVTVSTGTGNGTIRLDVTDDDSIVDLEPNPLGGTGTGNGNFTTGPSYTTSKAPIFIDVPFTYWANNFIERLYGASVTGGCVLSPLQYCPDTSVTRAQMAVFLEKGLHGSSFIPSTATGTKFSDVPTSHWAAAWIEALAKDGITGGCGNNNYCPDAEVTRAQMAVFLLKSAHGSAYNPPAASGTKFTDVASTYWAAAWIEQLAAEGITTGCGTGVYCPDSSVTRAQMAVFLVKVFKLP